MVISGGRDGYMQMTWWISLCLVVLVGCGGESPDVADTATPDEGVDSNAVGDSVPGSDGTDLPDGTEPLPDGTDPLDGTESPDGTDPLPDGTEPLDVTESPDGTDPLPALGFGTEDLCLVLAEFASVGPGCLTTLLEGLYCQDGGCVPDGSDNCLVMAECLADCDPTDSECKDECTSDGQFAELPKLEKYNTCVQACSPVPPNEFFACITMSPDVTGPEVFDCFEAYYECLTPDTGETDCSATYECMWGCEPDDPYCMSFCLEDTPSEAVALQAMWQYSCLAGNCGLDFEEECAETVEAGICAGGLSACTGANACTNMPDFELLQSKEFSGQLEKCVSKCGKPTKACLSNCLLGMTFMTPRCIECYSTVLDCIMLSCAAECGLGEEACKACDAEQGCTAVFVDCSGLVPNLELDELD